MQESPPKKITLIELRFNNRSRIIMSPGDKLLPGLFRIAAETFNLDFDPELSVKVDQQSYIVLCDRDIEALVHAGILKDDRWTFEIRDTTPPPGRQQPGVVWRSPTAPQSDSNGPAPRFVFAHEHLNSTQMAQLAQRGVQGPNGVYGLTSLPPEIVAQLPNEAVAFLFKK